MTDFRGLLPPARLNGGFAGVRASTGKQRIHLEVGCGNGAFLPWLAQSDPGAFVLGIEKDLIWARKAARKVRSYDNAEVVCYDAAMLFRQIRGLGRVDSIWMNFPDPWPKLRHAERRLASDRFLLGLATILLPDGCFHMATDVQPYFEEMTRLFSEAPGWTLLDKPPRAEVPVRTRFEDKWVAVGRPLYFLGARLDKSVAVEATVPLSAEPFLRLLAERPPLIRVHNTELRRGPWVARCLGCLDMTRPCPHMSIIIAHRQESGHLRARLKFVEGHWQWQDPEMWIAGREEFQLIADLVTG